MATLSDTLQQNQKTLQRGPNGELAYGSQPTQPSLQQLTGAAGLPAAPITPIGQASIGANPDQMKMAGTPQQKTAALNQSISQTPQAAVSVPQPPAGTQNLQQTLAEQQTSNQTTAEQQVQQQKSKDLANLGGLGDRVQSFIDSQKQAIGNAAGSQLTTGVSTTATNPLNGQPLSPDQQAALTKWAANPQDPNAVLAANQALGANVSDTTAKTLDPAQLSQLYNSATQTISAGAQSTVAPSLAVSDLIRDPKFGYDLPTLSNLLGVDQPTLANMNAQQLANAVAGVTSSQFNTTQQLQGQINSGLLGAAGTGLAQQAHRSNAATGVAASEQQMQNLSNSVSNADQVQFNGQTYTAEQLLGNSGISNIITTALNAGPNSTQMQQIQANEPQLYQYITQHQAALTQAANQMSGAATQFNTNIQSAQQMASDWGDVFGGAATLQSGVTGARGSAIVSAASQLSPEQQTAVKSQLQTLTANNPQLAQEMGNLQGPQAASVIQSVATNSPAWQSYQQGIQKAQAAQQIDTSTPQGQDAALQLLTGDGSMSMAKLQQMSSAAQAQQNLGMGSNTVLSQFGGQMPTAQQLQQLLQNNIQSPSLSNLASGQNQPSGQIQLAGPSPTALSAAQQSALTKLQGQASTPGQLTGNDLQAAGLTLDEALSLKPGQSNIDPSALQNLQISLRNQNTGSLIGKALNASTDPTAQISSLQQLLGSADAQHINNEEVNNQIQTIQDAVNASTDAAKKAQIQKQIQGITQYVQNSRF